MNREKLIANELQSMFLEEKLIGFSERYINGITKKLWTGEITVNSLLQTDAPLREKVLEALVRTTEMIK